MTDVAARGTTPLEVSIVAPGDVVWRELREPARIRHWHGWDAEGNDAGIELIYCTGVEEWPDEHRVRLNGGDTVTLHEQGDRTLVRLERAAEGVDPEMDRYREQIDEGWLTFLQQLRFALERHRDAERRTVYLSGVSSGAGDPRDELALRDIADGPAGSQYDDTVADERVGGQLWFRSERQLGLTVDEWGDGLLVVAAAPDVPDAPHGAAMAVLTTYGLDNAAFADLEARWTQWWQQHYPAA